MDEKIAFVLNDNLIELADGIGRGIVFTATLKPDENIYHVTWEDNVHLCREGSYYSAESVERNIKSGDWLLLQ